jgi:mRNA interferase MazF
VVGAGGRRTALNRGDGGRTAVIVTRDRAIPYLANVTVAGITRTVRELPTEVPVGRDQGLRDDSVVNTDNLFTIPKSVLGVRRGALDPEQIHGLDQALRIALGLD